MCTTKYPRGPPTGRGGCCARVGMGSGDGVGGGSSLFRRWVASSRSRVGGIGPRGSARAEPSSVLEPGQGDDSSQGEPSSRDPREGGSSSSAARAPATLPQDRRNGAGMGEGCGRFVHTVSASGYFAGPVLESLSRCRVVSSSRKRRGESKEPEPVRARAQYWGDPRGLEGSRCQTVRAWR